MPWPTNEALEALLEALFTFRQIEGPDKLVDFLQYELGREMLMARIAQSRKAEAGTKADAQREALESTVTALEFYADPDNYAPRRGQSKSAIDRDAGKVARGALEAIGEEGNGDD
jgi:hypothetical protein